MEFSPEGQAIFRQKIREKVDSLIQGATPKQLRILQIMLEEDPIESVPEQESEQQLLLPLSES